VLIDCKYMVEKFISICEVDLWFIGYFCPKQYPEHAPHWPTRNKKFSM